MDIRPEKPIKAMDIMAAVIRVMGMPLKGSGTSPNSMFSLIPAISDMASVKPIPAAKPKTVLVTRPYRLARTTAQNQVLHSWLL